MSDPELDRLKTAPAPSPSKEARDRALAAAMDAFDEAQAKEMRPSLKGSPVDLRQTSASPSWAWRMIMDNRLAIGGVAVCLIAAPLAAVMLAEQNRSPLGSAGQVAQVEPAEPQPQREENAAQDKRRTEAARGAGASNDLALIAPAEPGPKTAAATPPSPPAVSESSSAQHAPVPSRSGNRSLNYGDAASRANAQQDAAEGLGAVGGYGQAKPERSRRAAEPARIAPGVIAPAPTDIRQQEIARDRFANAPANSLKTTAQDPVSTFSIDADTASYSWVRRALMQGRAPSPEEVRVEELINYFPYDYARPQSADAPFRPTVAVYPSPWNRDTRIVHVGIKGFDAPTAVRPKANLVFLIDVSGSMSAPDKLPLVKSSLKLLLDRLRPEDRVSIVTYAGGTGVALEPTRAADRDTITGAIDDLQSGGSTAGAAGIEEAYRLARKSFDPQGVNRVLLATDGDFNVGLSDDDSLQRLVERERKSGVFLSVLGFGQGNYNDALMQRLAQNGNGTAAYIDQLEEAQKVLAEEAASTLFPIAKDVKIQVEFNPATVAEYRLIGYETRLLKREDFKDDRVDAGEVGSGAAVTALYEITRVGSPARLTESLRYAPQQPSQADAKASEDYGFLKLRYKLPNEDRSREIEQPIGKPQELGALAGGSDDVRFAAAVAAFGQKLRGDRQLSGMSWDEIATLAAGARGEDRWGYRAGFVRLTALAKALVRE